MRLKVFVILAFFTLCSAAHAQTRTKYTPKLPNFFEGAKTRGELISTGQIVATKVKQEEPDSFSVASTTENEKSPIGNPLGILPKKKVATENKIEKVAEEQNNEPKTNLEIAVSSAKAMAEEVRKSMGGDNIGYSKPENVKKFLEASKKAEQNRKSNSGNYGMKDIHGTPEGEYRF